MFNPTFQECNGAVLSVWYFCDQPFIPAGNVELEKLVHAAVLLILGQQTHSKGISISRCTITGVVKGSTCVRPSME